MSNLQNESEKDASEMRHLESEVRLVGEVAQGEGPKDHNHGGE